MTNPVVADNPLIKKKILSAGKQYVELKKGARVKFHFQTRKVENGNILIDDSRKMKEPMQLVIGLKFKLEVWEVIVQKMALHEVSSFTVDKSLVTQYPFISKTLRDASHGKCGHRHMCGMTLQNEGIGYKDLDDLMNKPCDLEFIIELLSIEMPDDYEKDRWQMSDDEKRKALVELKEKGNICYKEKKYEEAEKKYAEALALCEQLMLKERVHDPEWIELAEIKVPLLLNYSQCRLLAHDYYTVIQHCNEVLELQPNNVKAIFRRAKANFGAWKPEEAISDFKLAADLDVSLKGAVSKELAAISEQQKIQDQEDGEKFINLF